MKKVIFLNILLLLFIPIILGENSFNIDTSKLEINSKGNSLIEELDSKYKIKTDGFVSTETVNLEAKDYTKKIIKILFNSNIEDRSNDLHKEQYISSDNGFDTLSSLAFINMFVKEINDLNMKYDYIKLIRTVEFSEGVITLTYFPNVTINDEKEDFVLALYLKKSKDGYKLFFPWYTKGKDLEEYFNKLGDKEEQGEKIGESYKNISLGDDNNSSINDDLLNKLYLDNKDSNVSISALEDAGINSYGSGFYIGKGLVVTSWSLLLEILNNSEFLYVTDSNKNIYNIEGIVTADTEYDVVVLKLNKEVGKPVVFTQNIINMNDPVCIIDSKNNSGLMIRCGKNITNYSGKYKNLLAIDSSDVGSALYNTNSEVVGFNTNNSVNSDISIANSTEYLIKLQKKFNKEKFNNIKSSSFNNFKERYYHSYVKEKKINKIPTKIWDKYKRIGNIEENIQLELVKANYTDNIISLRYKNEASKSINAFYLIPKFEEELLKEDYKITYDSNSKKIYTKDESNIIVKQYLDYLIVIMMEN